jgi:predicted Zn-dependent protease
MKKRLFWFALLLAVAGLSILWKCGLPAYRRHKETNSLSLARGFMAKGDYANASIAARQTLLVNSNNLAACNLMAELAEVSHSPAALDWRRRIAELAPTVDNRVLLAAASLRVAAEPYSLAAQTLEDLGDLGKTSVAYQVVAAELALKLGKKSDAAAHFEAATRLEPTNEFNQLNLAVLRLQGTGPGAAESARATLERLAARPVVGEIALRWLVGECLRTNDLSGAERYSERLLSGPGVIQADRLEQLGILRQSHSPEFDHRLAAVQRDSLTNAGAAYRVAKWMTACGLADQAQMWLGGCSAKLRSEQPVPLAQAECYLARRDWPGLESFLAGRDWQEFNFLRLAFLSRSAEQQQQKLVAESRWRGAVRESENQIGSLAALLGLARSWGRARDATDLLWRMGDHFPREKWIWRELGRELAASGDTPGLKKLYATMAGNDPANFAARNNFAATSLLLKSDLPEAHAMARKLYQEHPQEPVIASTYAWSLHLQGSTKEGLAVLEKLPEDQRAHPSVALYYGLLEAAAGDSTKGRRYLSLAREGALLPEEKALLTEALENRLRP